MSGPWIEPKCSPLTAVAPTTVNALIDCPKRVAFQRDDRTKELQRPSTRTALGRVAHRLTELVLRGHGPEPAERRTWLEEEWDRAVADEARTLAEAWAGRLVPPPKRWPGYVATRTRLIRRLTTAVVTTDPAAPHSSGPGGGQPPLPWVERKLSDGQIELYGTPDLVEDRSGSLWVVDLKSGVHQDALDVKQRRQLLLYAHLVAKVTGRPVKHAAIVDVRGQETTISVAADEISEQIELLLDSRDAFNNSLRSGAVEARPAKDTCRFCPFKVACRSYFEAWQEEWGSDVLVGTVTEFALPNVAVVSRGDSLTRLILDKAASVNIGDDVAVSGLEPAGPATVRMRWDGRILAG